MSRGLRWTEEELHKRGWRDPDLRADTEEFKRVVKLNNTLLAQLDAENAIPAPIQPRQRMRAAKTRKAVPYERDVLRAVLAALQAHPRVSWAVRLNSGMAMLPGRGGKPQPVRFGFEGAPDIIGQLKQGPYKLRKGLNADVVMRPAWDAGVFLGIEVKRPGKKATMAQAAFLLRVRESGGVGFVAHDISDVWEHLGKP